MHKTDWIVVFFSFRIYYNPFSRLLFLNSTSRTQYQIVSNFVWLFHEMKWAVENVLSHFVRVMRVKLFRRASNDDGCPWQRCVTFDGTSACRRKYEFNDFRIFFYFRFGVITAMTVRRTVDLCHAYASSDRIKISSSRSRWANKCTETRKIYLTLNLIRKMKSILGLTLNCCAFGCKIAEFSWCHLHTERKTGKTLNSWDFVLQKVGAKNVFLSHFLPTLLMLVRGHTVGSYRGQS